MIYTPFLKTLLFILVQFDIGTPIHLYIFGKTFIKKLILKKSNFAEDLKMLQDFFLYFNFNISPLSHLYYLDLHNHNS